MRNSATGTRGGAVGRSPGPARSQSGRGRLAGKIEQLRRTPYGSPWKLRNWPLRTKLLVVLLIPSLTAVVLIGLQFNTQLGAASRLSELSARVSTDRSMADLVHALQRERDMTVHYVAAGRKNDDPEFARQRDRVDAKLGEFSKAISAAEPDLSAGSVRELDGLREELDTLSRLRYAVQHDNYPADTVLRAYNGLISALLSARDRSVATVNEPELVRLQLAGSALSRVKDQMSVTRALVDEALVLGKLTLDRKRMLVSANSDVAAWRNDFRKFATAAQQRMYDDTVTGLLFDQRNEILEAVLSLSDTGRPFDKLDRAQWDTSATYTVNLVREVEEALLVRMQERADALAADARTTALRDGAIVVALLLIAALLAVVIGRSLLRPLRILRSTALEVAEYRLPAAVHGLLADPNAPRKTDVAPVPVTSTEEVGQVARAFDAVHGEAVRLAAEQAELRKNVNAMFVNLSRRGQELADRQLDVLDRMEANEPDPDTLAALFELDHLATRSRRICENLLVLTGNDFARLLPGTVPASEVVGAALSEIEHYQRVELRSVPQVAVRGNAASDVVHVISELLENATNGSAPETLVTVSSSVDKEGNWLVEITDCGAGMTDEDIDRANARLADPPEIDVEATRRMGMYVVARLAQRNDLAVRLRTARGGGLTASVLIPSRLLGELPAGVDTTPSAEPGRRPEWLETASKRQTVGSPRAPRTAGPPRRAPIVARPEAAAAAEPVPAAHPLDDDLPTERMPMYRDLLSKWFERPGPAAGTPDARTPDADAATVVREPVAPPEPAAAPEAVADRAAAEAEAAEAEAADAEAAETEAVEPQPEPEFVAPWPRSPEPAVTQLEPDLMPRPPAPAPAAASPAPATRSAAVGAPIDTRTVRTTRRADAANGVNSMVRPSGKPADFAPPVRGKLDLGSGSAPVRPPAADQQREASSDLLRDGSTGQQPAVDGRHPSGAISRDPEAVRSRMLSLAEGVRRARHASVGEYADRGLGAREGT